MLSTKQLQNNNFQIGFLGESIALDFLASNGYIIVTTNLSWKKFELDILAKTSASNSANCEEQILVFVEIKTRVRPASNNLLNQIPTHTAYTSRKHSSLRALARKVIQYYKWTGPIRFDLITVDLELTKKTIESLTQLKNKTIHHYKHVMY